MKELSHELASLLPPDDARSSGSTDPALGRMFPRCSLVFLSALSLGAGSVLAQSAAVADDDEDEVFELSPFEVSSEGSTGYSVKDTLAGARIRTSLKDTPASLSVVTSQFLEDVNVNNAEDLLVYTTNTEVGGLYGNYSGLASRGDGVSFGSESGLRLVNPGSVNRSRGLTSMDNTRNYFPSDIPWDGYNIDRVDISRGPNSFLFGTGSPSGISNVSTRQATFDDFGSVEFNYGSYGSTRESLDYNKQVTEEFAVRLDLMNSNSKFKQKPAFRDMTRGYVALRYDPKFLKTDSAYTQIKASYEHGEGTSNSPRTLPPVDYITGYLNDPRASDTGIDPWMFTQDSTGKGGDPDYSLWAGAGSIGNRYQWSGNAQFFFDSETGAMLKAEQSGFSVGTGSDPNTWNVHSVGYGSYAVVQNQLYRQANGGQDGGEFAGAGRTVSYFDQTLTDTSIFDFYNKLIDGDNKREWQDWDAYNVSITQGLFNDRLSIQAVLDHQEYNYGYNGAFSNQAPILMLDLDQYLLSGNPSWIGDPTPNPNVGRPVVFGDQGKEDQRETRRDNYQVTAAYQLDFAEDLGADGLWAEILGKHSFTGLWSQYERFSESRSYKMNGVDSSFYRETNNANAQLKDNNFNWLSYVGPSLLGSTGAGSDLNALRHPLSYPSSVNFSVWSDAWKDNSIDPAAEWVYTDKAGDEITGTQADNPANYVGYVPVLFPMINGESNPAVLATGGNKASQIIESKAFMYQGHFWNDTIIPSFGYREDTTKQNGASPDSSTPVINLDYDITGPGAEETTNSMSYGVAIHLPKAIKERLPSGTDLTFYYFHGENETPKVRYGLDGLPLPNESGETEDISVQFDGFNGRLTARLTHFTTKNQNSSASVGVPLATWMVQSLPALTLQYGGWGLAERDLGFDPVTKEVYNAPAQWDSWMKEANQWRWRPHSWMDTRPEEAAAFEQAMMTSFVETFPQSYWDAWGYNVDVEAIKAGDWLNVNPTWQSLMDFGHFGGSSTINGEYPTIDQNLESKGLELEVTIRPLDGWDITFNGSKVDATQTGYGEGASKVLNGMADLYLGTAVGYGNFWNGFEGNKDAFLSDIWSAYLKQVALVGGVQPEMRKYRFNFISNYSFKEGKFKGVNVGGAFRWEDKAIQGYAIHETEIYGETAWIGNVNDPLWGPTNEHLDLWAGYEHALNDNVDWKVQLNVRNVGEKSNLVPVAYQPNGDIAQARISGGAEYNVSLKFSY